MYNNNINQSKNGLSSADSFKLLIYNNVTYYEKINSSHVNELSIVRRVAKHKMRRNGLDHKMFS